MPMSWFRRFTNTVSLPTKGMSVLRLTEQNLYEYASAIMVFSLIGTLWLTATAFAVDLSVEENSYEMTPVHQIESGKLEEMPFVPVVYKQAPPNNPQNLTPLESIPNAEQPVVFERGGFNKHAELKKQQNQPQDTQLQRPKIPTTVENLQQAEPAEVTVEKTTTTKRSVNVTEYLNDLTSEMKTFKQRPVHEEVRASYAIFPVLPHSSFNKAYSDLPVMLSTQFATELSKRLYDKDIDARVINPIHSYDIIREQGLEKVYRRLVQDYMQAGIPLNNDLYALTDALSSNLRKVEWVAFVEADLDMNHITRPPRFYAPISKIYEQVPKNSRYYAKSNVKVFKLTPDGAFLVWQGKASATIKADDAGSVTGSVFDTGSSYGIFKQATGSMAGWILDSMPPSLNPTKAVQAKVVGQNH